MSVLMTEHGFPREYWRQNPLEMDPNGLISGGDEGRHSDSRLTPPTKEFGGESTGKAVFLLDPFGLLAILKSHPNRPARPFVLRAHGKKRSSVGQGL